VLDLILFEVIFLVYLAPREFKENSSVSGVVNVELLCIVFSDLWAVVILIKASLEEFSIFFLSLFQPLFGVIISRQVVLLEFVDEVALIVGELVSVDEVTHPEGTDHVHDVSLTVKEVHAFIVEVEAVYTLAKALGILAETLEKGKDPGREVIAI